MTALIIISAYVLGGFLALRLIATGTRKCDRSGCNCARHHTHPHSIALSEQSDLAVGQGETRFHSQTTTVRGG